MSFAAKYQHDLFLNNSVFSQYLTFFLIPHLKYTSDVVLPQETVPNLLDPPYINIVEFQESLLPDSNYLACS